MCVLLRPPKNMTSPILLLSLYIITIVQPPQTHTQAYHNNLHNCKFIIYVHIWIVLLNYFNESIFAHNGCRVCGWSASPRFTVQYSTPSRSAPPKPLCGDGCVRLKRTSECVAISEIDSPNYTTQTGWGHPVLLFNDCRYIVVPHHAHPLESAPSNQIQ